MAKRNPYWGKQKGKLGETVLAVNKGQQVQRAYNANPVNPKTRQQTGQRVKFACAVKFFKAAVAKSFAFAYEDKKQQESDYNAFMRHNTNISGLMFRELYENPKVAGYGPYVVAKGSLREVTAVAGTDGKITYAFGATQAQAPTTCQQVASAFKAGYNLYDGDIITIYHIVPGMQTPDLTDDRNRAWGIIQIKVGDTTDTRTLASVGSAHGITATTSGLQCTPRLPQSDWDLYGVIVSRQTTNGLRVSTCKLAMSLAPAGAYSRFRTGANFNDILNDWGATAPAVLEGSELPME